MQRKTKQRAAVLEQLRQQHDFRSAQQVHDDLISAGQTVSLATVYRNLQLLADNEEVDTVRGVDGELAYRLCEDDAHHHHLICRSCGNVREITPQHLESWVSELAEQHGFYEPSHFLEVFGTCSDCYAKENS